MGFENFSFLARKLPSFKIHGSQVRIIHDPSVFYQELVNRSKSSHERIVMSALYWGIEERERRLRDTVAERLSSSSGGLRVKILLDWCRGTRMVKNESSASLLRPLHDHNNDKSSCRLSFYQTPQLRGWLNRILPSKWNELIGLQHCKVYIFDDSLIISGANLSQDYFTNRQDRYVLIENCKDLADYYEDLLDQISKFSFEMNTKGKFSSSSSFENLSLKNFVSKSCQMMQSFLSHHQQKHQVDISQDYDTIIFPTLQMGLFGINQDCDITSDILKAGASNSTFYFATGYFNLIERYMKNILETTKSNYNILMAHPEANGFLGAKFPAGGIPHAYTLMAKQFLERVTKASMEDRIKLHEFRKKNWTFHGKGLWYCENGRPILTMVGSPNFGYRSERRDLESQVIILTKNEDLQQRLLQEQKHLFHHSEAANNDTFNSEERVVPLWVKFVMSVAKKWF